MAGLLESVKEHFDTTNLYEALGVDKHADEAVLKRAYRRLSLRVHPDRVPSDEVAVATTRFQVATAATVSTSLAHYMVVAVCVCV